MTATPAEQTAEYTIDELAAAAKLPSRTIRFYQGRGALQPPEIRGRVAYYGPAHVERLKLIAQLQDRGLRIDAIRDLVASIDRGELDLMEWLGVEQQMQASWAHDRARTVTEEELYQLAGTRRPGLIADLVRTQIVQRAADVYLVRSPALLAVGMKLEAVGVDLDTSAQASMLLRKHMTRAADELVELFVKRAESGDMEAKQTAKLFESLRPLGTESVRIVFGRAMERSLRTLHESGKIAKLSGRQRKKKTR